MAKGLNYVYSTGTNSAYYALHDTNPNSPVSIVKKKVLIKGGHGVASADTARHIFTPKGVCTIVSDEDMSFLLENPTFQKHVKRGFITYDKKEIAPEKKAADMEDKDKSAPLTPKDFIVNKDDDSSIATYTKKGAPTL